MNEAVLLYLFIGAIWLFCRILMDFHVLRKFWDDRVRKDRQGIAAMLFVVWCIALWPFSMYHCRSQP